MLFGFIDEATNNEAWAGGPDFEIAGTKKKRRCRRRHISSSLTNELDAPPVAVSRVGRDAGGDQEILRM
jgi:hypothetical protein